MMLAALLSSALAATVYVNGVRVDMLPDATLGNVTVRLDSAGNVWITAPQYSVQEVPAGGKGTATAPSAASSTPAGGTGSVPTNPASPSGAVPSGQWWLVTQDDSAGGHSVDVVINGTTVRRVSSGEAQVLLDVGGYLRHGANTVRLVPVPGSRPGAGTLTVYIGRGSSTGGTVRIDRADIRYVHGADSVSGAAKDYVLQVP